MVFIFAVENLFGIFGKENESKIYAFLKIMAEDQRPWLLYLGVTGKILPGPSVSKGWTDSVPVGPHGTPKPLDHRSHRLAFRRDFPARNGRCSTTLMDSIILFLVFWKTKPTDGPTRSIQMMWTDTVP